jgi:hypothetical protein
MPLPSGHRRLLMSADALMIGHTIDDPRVSFLPKHMDQMPRLTLMVVKSTGIRP